MLLSKHMPVRREDHTSGGGFVHFLHPPYNAQRVAAKNPQLRNSPPSTTPGFLILCANPHDAQKSQGLGCVTRSGRIEGISTPSPLWGFVR